MSVDGQDNKNPSMAQYRTGAIDSQTCMCRFSEMIAV